MGREFRYTCDFADCNSSEPVPESDKELPDGWITLTVHVKGGRDSALLLCGNRCVGRVTKERLANDRAAGHSKHTDEARRAATNAVAELVNLDGLTKTAAVQSVSSSHRIAKSTLYKWFREDVVDLREPVDA